MRIMDWSSDVCSSDLEIGPVLPAAREWLDDEVRIASIDGKPLTSIGGLQIHPEAALADLDPVEADLWLLPGSDRWRDGEIAALTSALRTRRAAGQPPAQKSVVEGKGVSTR